MSIAKTIEAPQWVDSGSVLTGGLDLLGLRVPVQTIGGSLLDGVTTVSPSVRYIGFRAWLIYRYGESQRPDSWREFTDFSAYAESALVLGNLLQNRSIYGLIGADEGLVRVEAQTPQITISPLVKTPATTVYAGPSEQLGISWSRDEKVPGISAERGKPLALALDGTIGKIPLIEQIFGGTPPGEASRDALMELGAAARIDRIPDVERERLIAAVLPETPLVRERNRIATYAALLTLAKQKGVLPTEQDIFTAACSLNRFGEHVLDHAADGWLSYCVRDAIAVSQEAVLAAVINEITHDSADGKSGVESSRIVTELMARVEEHDAPLRDLKLVGASESISDLTFRQLFTRVHAQLTPGRHQERGISRWSSALNEPDVYNLALRSGAGALSLAVVAWIMAAIRVGTAVRENLLEFGNLSYQGWRRQGLREVILPEIERLLREDQPLTRVAADFAYRVVQQHLQIAWSRLQFDVQRDVALITAEGNRWFSRGKGYGAGRTLSRLREALGWMTQLKLIDVNGITSDGGVVLARALRVLSDGISA
jgi:hypothetical protein